MELEDLREEIRQTEKRFPDEGTDFLIFALSDRILRTLVGDKWVNSAIYPYSKDQVTRDDRKYLSSKTLGIQWQSRVKTLAEKLFNLQDICGIERIIDEIRHGNLSSRFAELDAGSFLYRRKVSFEFVIPQGKKGLDFDIKIADAVNVNCEVKHKIDNLIPTKEIIQKTLHNAHEQVPSNESSLFFIKFPEEWTTFPTLPKILYSGMESFFSRNKNSLGVVFMWEHKISKFPDLKGWGWIYRFEANPYFIGDSYLDLFSKLSGPSTKEVIDLRKFTEDNL